jgi:hypothetical protein
VCINGPSFPWPPRSCPVGSRLHSGKYDSVRLGFNRKWDKGCFQHLNDRIRATVSAASEAVIAFFRRHAHIARVPKRALGACADTHRPSVSRPSSGEENRTSFKITPVTGAAGDGAFLWRGRSKSTSPRLTAAKRLMFREEGWRGVLRGVTERRRGSRLVGAQMGGGCPSH